MKGNSFTFLQDIGRHSRNINGRQGIVVDRRIWRGKKRKKEIYKIYGVANSQSWRYNQYSVSFV